MTYIKSLVIAALLSIDTVFGATDAKYSYLANGADWVLKTDDWVCHKNNQSPIDLKNENAFEQFNKWNGNEFKKMYSNIKGAKIGNFGNTIKLVFKPYDKDGDDNAINEFQSKFASEQLGSTESFYAAQFHFHAGSEHTINGKRYDFEMHTVHLPGTAEEGKGLADGEGSPVPILASATGLIFDTVDFDPTISPEDRKIIDNFFDSLNFESLPPTVPGAAKSVAAGHSLNPNASVPYGDLMRIVNFANRWVYIGSLTTPPCSIGVLHQVVDRILPISRRHMELYRKHQHAHPQVEYFEAQVAAPGYVVKTDATNVPMDITGNWRETQKITPAHNVTYMRVNYNPDPAGDQQTTAIVIAILLVISLITLGVLVFMCMGFQKKISAKSSVSPEGGHRESALKNLFVRE